MMRKTKIVCTVGPASSSLETLRKMAVEGMDVARLNFSHGDYASHLQRYEGIRRISAELGREIGILQDLPGAKIRIGGFGGQSVWLKEGSEFVLKTRPCEGNERQVYIDYPRLESYVKPGDRVMLDDGNLQLRVEKRAEGEIRCRVEIGGELKERKGAVFPDSDLPMPPITGEDIKALEFGARMGVDAVAVSFVREAENVLEVREVLKKCGASHVQVVAKIEERRGFQNLKSILEVSDAVMVARGDLGVCMPREEVPLLQERIIKTCRKRGKPVIVATQMLESMVSNRTPTRAEVTDVAQAVLQGADALMLSAETAVGKYPVEAVRELATVIDTVERSEEFRRLLKSREYYPEIPTLQQSICMAMDVISESAQVKAMVVETDGRSVKLLSSYRPLLPIYAAVPDETVARSLLLWWGVRPMVGTAQEVIQKLKASGILKERDKVLVSKHIVRTPFEAELKVVES